MGNILSYLRRLKIATLTITLVMHVSNINVAATIGIEARHNKNESANQSTKGLEP
jgi:hypothetical protein